MFKVGDKVKIIKYSDTCPSWWGGIPNNIFGKVGCIESISGTNIYVRFGSYVRWLFHKEWLEKVIQEKKKCSLCGEDTIDYQIVEDDVLCRKCFDKNFTICAHCDDIISKCDSYFSNLDDGYYCENCFYDIFTYCESCERLLYRDDAYWNDDDEPFCSDCWGEYRNIHEYGYTPAKKFNKINAHEHRFFGIEIETGNNSSNRNSEIAEFILNKYDNRENQIYITSDSSVSGFELTTQPMSYNYIRQNKKFFKDILEDLSKEGMHANAENIGQHIHVSRKRLDFFTELKLVMFFNQCQYFICKFSGRTESEIDRWAPFNSLSDKISQSITNKINMKNEFKRLTFGRYCLNFNNSATIEFRIFRGTLNYEQLINYIRFVDTCLDFVESVGTSYIIRKRYLIWNDYLEFLRTNKFQLYKILKEIKR